MNFKIVLAIFAAFAVAQSSAKYIQVQDDSDTLKTISDALLQLSDAIATVLGEVSKTIKEAESKTTDVEAGISEIITGFADKIFGYIMKEIDGVADKADDQGKKVIACMDKGVDGFQALLDSTIDDIVTCSSDQLAELIDDVKVLVDDVAAANEQLKTLEANLGTCKTGLALCGLDFLNKAATTGGDLLTTLKTDAEAAQKIIDATGDKIDACIVKNLEAMETKNSEFFNEMVTCYKS